MDHQTLLQDEHEETGHIMGRVLLTAFRNELSTIVRTQFIPVLKIHRQGIHRKLAIRVSNSTESIQALFNA
jgi:hypothetical protein